MSKHRIRISGQIHHNYEQVIELSDEELLEFRNQLNIAKRKGDQGIDDFLGNNFGDTEPIDWQCDEWSAEIIKEDGSTIEHLDAN